MSWTWWMTLLVIFAALALIGCIPVGGDIRYSQEGFFLSLVLGPVRLQLIPRKKKKRPAAKKKQRPAKKQTAAPERAQKKTPAFRLGGVEGAMQLLEFAGDVLGDARRKLRVNELTLYVTFCGADDPAKAAISYGRAWAAIGAMTPALERLFFIRKRDIRPMLDQQQAGMKVDAHLILTITIGRALALAVHAGIAFLKLMNQRKESGERS